MTEKATPVYFMPLPDGVDLGRQRVAVKKLYKASGAARIVQKKDLVAIKVHVGEQHNTTHVPPELIREIVTKIKGKGGQVFLAETSTLYKGQRDNAVKHLLHAHTHGFSIERCGAPLIMLDGLCGNSEGEVQIGGELHESVKLARELLVVDTLFVVSHPTGHPATGMAGCLKNLGMGLAGRMGKMRQHSSMKPEIIGSKCCCCQKCLRWCPVGAIYGNGEQLSIDRELCIGCGQCLAVCRFEAVKFNWGTEVEALQKHIAEYAYGAVKDKTGKCFYFNVLIDMTKGCDCYSTAQQKCLPDIGILASADPVAIDMASLDLTRRDQEASLAEIAFPKIDPLVQLRHAEALGMGQLDYQLITLE
ncbi:MAG: DUF362 domain-containing protein [bacterium]|nr:DUF362 domain-containing protein [bacterium]